MRVAAVLVLLFLPVHAAAAPDADVEVPATVPAAKSPEPTAEARFNEGQALARQNDWVGATAAYHAATRLRPAFAEAWNGLGYALRKQRRFDESVSAYREALRLRPNYPQALEYLGAAYVELGRLDEARAVLARLRRLDPREADELAQAIAKAAKR